MKILTTLTLVLTVFFTLPSYSQEWRKISVTGMGEVKLDADHAKVTLSAQSERPTAEEAKLDVDTKVNQLIEALSEIGLSRENLTAGQLSVSPRYDYRGTQRIFLGYSATRQMVVEIPNLDGLNSFLDVALTRRIDGIEHIQYLSSLEDEAALQARQMAVEDATTKARELAVAFGMVLGPIISVEYHSFKYTPVQYAEAQMVSSARMGDMAGQYIPDQLSVTDNIAAVFELTVAP